jgi:CO/xanthine dehydrogenase FAD-binding subunit
VTTAAPAYERAASLALALERIGAGGVTIIAGGTDYYPSRVGRPTDAALLDIADLAELRSIETLPDHWRIGATTTWTDLLAAPLPAVFDGLRQAAREVGGPQIQNAGTIGGNLCNASPAADGIPALLALDAVVELRSLTETTTVPLSSFILGPRRTRRAEDQLVTAVLIPRPKHLATSRFAKLGARRYLVISIVMASACLEVDATGTIRTARVAVGACSPVARRLPTLEQHLTGVPFGKGLGDLVAHEHLAPLSPIDDVRASREYRLDTARTVVARLLDELPAPR